MSDSSESPEEKAKRESYRKNIVKEIVSSEERYVEALRTLVDCYCKPLEEAIKAGNPIIDQQVYDSIFHNINLITNFNERLLGSLKNMKDDFQVGDIFTQFAPFLKMYTAYTDSSESAMKVVRELMSKEAPAVLTLLSKDRNLSRGLGIRRSFKDWCESGERENKERLESLLIQPVQRVPRYRMLLAELLKFTHPSNPDFKRLEKALETVEYAATHCNEGLHKRTREEERARLHQRFPKQLKWTSKSLEARTIVLEEMMYKIDRKGTCRPNVVILFSDLLAYGKGTKGGEVDFSHVLSLSKMTVGNRAEFTDQKGVQYKYIFQVKSPSKSFALAAESEVQRAEWVDRIRKAIADSTGADAPMTKTAPIWEPDRKDCSVCKEKFSFFTGKRCHHCRNCGICVCASCSPHNVVLKWFDPVKPQRVCSRCYPKICFSDRVERFYEKWDATRLEQPGWLDGIVDENFDRKEAFMSELVARFGPEPSDPTGGSSARSKSVVSQGSSGDNVQALKTMATNLEEEKDELVSIGLAGVEGDAKGEGQGGAEGKEDSNSNSSSSTSNGGGNTNDNGSEDPVPVEVQKTEAVEKAEDSLRWDERLWIFFQYYDAKQLTDDANFVAKLLMTCSTEPERKRLMRALETKYGPEADARSQLAGSLVEGASPQKASTGEAGAPTIVAVADTDSDSDADEVDANIW